MIHFKTKRPSSILGLSFEGSRLDAVVLRRANGSCQQTKSLSATLALSPLTGDPELVGREIRNHLEQAGIRERRCVVCLPQSWAITLHVALPELPEADVASFLQIEAERGFPSSPDTLTMVRSTAVAGTEQQAALVAVARAQIANLEAVLKAAQLKPESFSLGLTAMQSPADPRGVLALSLGYDSVGLQASCGGGIAALRFLDGGSDADGGPRRLDADILAREIRITLGQLPEAFQKAIRLLRVFGRGDMARQFADDIRPRAEAMGLAVELIDRTGPGYFETVTPVGTALTPALALAARFLAGEVTPFEFLPPKVHPLQQFFSSQVSSKKLVVGVCAAGVVLLAVAGLFGWQQWQINHLKSQWSKMDKDYAEVDYAHKQIRKFRPWFDESVRSLTILRKITEVFPKRGTVTAKSLEIREGSVVTCTATASDNQSVIKLLEALRGIDGVVKVDLEQQRGQAPSILFTFNLQWAGENSNAN
jgi:putative intracellular protease/amidase